MSGAIEIFSIGTRLQMQFGQLTMVPQGGAGGLVRIYSSQENRRMLILVTNPGTRRALLRFTPRLESADENVNVVLTANRAVLDPKSALQLDRNTTRVVEVALRGGRGIVWVEIASDRDVIPSGEIRVERTLVHAEDLHDGLPVHWDSQAISWFKLPPPPPQLPGGEQTTTGPGPVAPPGR